MFSFTKMVVYAGKRRNPDGKTPTNGEIHPSLIKFYDQYPSYHMDPRIKAKEYKRYFSGTERDKPHSETYGGAYSWGRFSESFDPYVSVSELDYFHEHSNITLHEILESYLENPSEENFDYAQFSYVMKTPEEYVIPICFFEKVKIADKFIWKLLY